MPSESHDTAAASRPNDHEVLQVVRQRAREARRECRRDWRRHGAVTDSTKVQTAECAVDYRDVLVDYREQVTNPPWDERDVDWIMSYVGEQVERQTPKPGLHRGTESDTRPAFVTVEAARLFRLTKKFDQIWRELGFGAEVAEQRALHMVPDGSETA